MQILEESRYLYKLINNSRAFMSLFLYKTSKHKFYDIVLISGVALILRMRCCSF